VTARPMPLLAPVTTATLSASGISMIVPLRSGRALGLDGGEGGAGADGPVEGIVGDVLPTGLAEDEVGPSGELLIVGDRG
jgi:hypothetical protein